MPNQTAPGELINWGRSYGCNLLVKLDLDYLSFHRRVQCELYHGRQDVLKIQIARSND
jgi:hypothetical protein